tara:strand:+ start:3010 stop:3861 length:852 start_codon:yes stop_codon:yes gene_type:complete
MEEFPLVTCVIISYNRPKLAIESIESALNQDYPNLEVILVNDCSVESYEELERKYEGRVRFLRTEKNSGGCSVPRNTGAAAANGKYIAFLDDDDAWLPEKTKRQVDVLEKYDDVVACSCGHQETVSGLKKLPGEGVLQLSDILMSNKIGPPSKLMIRADLTSRMGFDPELRHAEDWDYYLRVLSDGKIHVIPEVLLMYNTSHHERMTNGFSKMSFEDMDKKLYATRKNRALIGEFNFEMRRVHYYLTGLKARQHKLRHMIAVMHRTSPLAVMRYLYFRAKGEF